MQNYLLNKEQYQSVLAAWKVKSAHSSAEHIIYNLLRSFEPNRGFTPFTNATKLNNGQYKYAGLQLAIMNAKLLLSPPVKSSWNSADDFDKRVKAYYKSIEAFGITHDAALVDKLYTTLREYKYD